MIRPPYNKTGLTSSVDISTQKTKSIIPYKQKQNKVLYIPAFSVTDIPWLGASYCVIKFFYSISNNISFPQIFTNNGEYNFVPVLWWIDDDDVIHRYKLWHDDDMLLYCPVYNGERLPLQFAIEIYPLHEETTVTLSEPLRILTSILVAPGTPCFTDAELTLNNETNEGTDYQYDLETYTWSGTDGDYFTNLEPFVYFGETEFTDIITPPAAPVIAWGEEAHPPPYAASEITWTIEGDDPDYFVFYKKHNVAPIYDYRADDLYTDASHSVVYGESPTWQIPGNIRAAWSPAFYETDGLPYPLYELKIKAFKDGLESDDSNVLFASERV